MKKFPPHPDDFRPWSGNLRLPRQTDMLFEPERRFCDALQGRICAGRRLLGGLARIEHVLQQDLVHRLVRARQKIPLETRVVFCDRLVQLPAVFRRCLAEARTEDRVERFEVGKAVGQRDLRHALVGLAERRMRVR